MKHTIFYLLLLMPLFFACTAEDLPSATNYGSLRIFPVEIETEAEIEPIKRSVDSRLQVDIYQGSTIVRTYEAGSSELDGLIVLPVGSYTLTAHTPDMNEAANEESGSPTYLVNRDFKIEPDITTTLGNLVARQANIGINLQYTDELFTTGFMAISCTLTSPATGRTVTLQGTDNPGMTYFNVPASGKLQYTIQATNTDGEQFTYGPKDMEATGAGNCLLLIGWSL